MPLLDKDKRRDYQREWRRRQLIALNGSVKPRCLDHSLAARIEFYSCYAGDCIVWTGTTNNRGYGMIGVADKDVLAHRLAYELARGPIPEGLTLDHLCRNRICVNPAHLEPVTMRENIRRGIKGVLTTHCPQGHAYDAENTYITESGWRVCRTCKRERAAARYARGAHDRV